MQDRADGSMVLPPGDFLGKVRHRALTGDFVITEVVDRESEPIPVHTHTEPHFLLVLAGRYRTSARSAEPNCAPATVIFNPAGTTHRDRFEPRGGAFLTVSLSTTRLGHFEGPAVAYQDSAEAWLAGRLFRERHSADPEVIESLATELLARATEGEPPTPASPPGWFVRAREMLDDLFPAPLRVAAVAESVGVHPFHLARSFRRFVGRTPGEYLRERRVRHAAGLLRRSRISLAAVAFQAGFNDQSQFTKTFRRYTGFTPSVYRTIFGDVGSAQDGEAGGM